MRQRFAIIGITALGLIGAGTLTANGALAAGDGVDARAEASLARALAKRLPRTKATRIDCGVVAGLCEVQAGANLFYTDRSGRYLVVGRVYDMETRQDLTAARLLQINPDMLAGTGAMAARDEEAGSDMGEGADAAYATASPGGAGAKQPVAQAAPMAPTTSVSLAGLPESGAIAWGRGPSRITVFSDFHCGYCKLLHQQLKAMDVRVIERPISLLGTRMVSNAVICAADPQRALEQAYDGADLPARVCDTSGLDANERFARAHGFDGTPVIVREDGAVLHGYRPREVLEAWVAAGRAGGKAS
ncbi:DsbC family protein [Novosphingobium sp. CCH12-A3]|uniref:DsbC family protein n=1 Tax=Novosphingobium sp. CCH12-A3 TaxID=1768752 RepID=UPI000785E723|nr:DsbC family protein [Novosphingobium sp. CCH12-A3]